MTTPLRPSPRRDSPDASSAGTWTHALLWVLLVVAGLLLVGFTAVVDDITERGELRRAHQRTSGSPMPPGEMSAGGVDAMRLLSLTGEKLAGR